MKPWAHIDSTKTISPGYDPLFVTTLWTELGALQEHILSWDGGKTSFIHNPFSKPVVDINTLLHVSKLYGEDFKILKGGNIILDNQYGYNEEFQKQYGTIWIYEAIHATAGITIQNYRLLICEK